MTRVIFIFWLVSFNLNAQDSLLLTERITCDQDSNVIRRWTGKYNEFGRVIFTESVNYQRQDTCKIRTFYDHQKRISKYIQNGPYFPDRYDTTYYVYSGDTTMIIQGDQHHQRITKKDKLDRRFYFSSKMFDENNILILHKLDSVIFDDVANSRTTRAYRMENYPPPKPRKLMDRIHIDGKWVEVERDGIQPVFTEAIKESRLELTGTSFVQYNSNDKATYMVTSFPGNKNEVIVEYDSLGRQVRHEIYKRNEDYRKITTYEYVQKGDTLIRHQRNSETPEDLYISKASLEQRDEQPLWQISFFNGIPSGRYFRTYNEHGSLIETSHWRAKKDTDELMWNIERTVYRYKRLPVSE